MKNLALIMGASLAVLGYSHANAATQQTGNYVSLGIGDNGSFYSLQHAKNGDQNFGVNDYITPGTPHEAFGYSSTQSGFQQNGNASGTAISGSLTATGATSAYAFGATWTGADDFIQITNTYGFNADDQRIYVTTTITALTDLTNFSFARGVDPDPDVNTNGDYDTNNQYGNALFGPTDFVGSAGATTGLTLGLLNLSGNTWVHNTQINSSCCELQNPVDILSGFGAIPGASTGDYGLNMAWLIGDLATGASATISYAYVVGENIDVVGGVGGVPEPSTWAVMILGFGAAGTMLRRRRTAAMAAA